MSSWECEECGHQNDGSRRSCYECYRYRPERATAIGVIESVLARVEDLEERIKELEHQLGLNR